MILGSELAPLQLGYEVLCTFMGLYLSSMHNIDVCLLVKSLKTLKLLHYQC